MTDTHDSGPRPNGPADGSPLTYEELYKFIKQLCSRRARGVYVVLRQFIDNPTAMSMLRDKLAEIVRDAAAQDAVTEAEEATARLAAETAHQADSLLLPDMPTAALSAHGRIEGIPVRVAAVLAVAGYTTVGEVVSYVLMPDDQRPPLPELTGGRWIGLINCLIRHDALTTDGESETDRFRQARRRET